MDLDLDLEQEEPNPDISEFLGSSKEERPEYPTLQQSATQSNIYEIEKAHLNKFFTPEDEAGFEVDRPALFAVLCFLMLVSLLCGWFDQWIQDHIVGDDGDAPPPDEHLSPEELPPPEEASYTTLKQASQHGFEAGHNPSLNELTEGQIATRRFVSSVVESQHLADENPDVIAQNLGQEEQGYGTSL